MDATPPPPRLTTKKAIRNPFSDMQPGEQIICEIRRHPIGIVGMYAAMAALLATASVLAFAVLPHALGYGSGQAAMLGTIVVIITAALCGGFLFIITKIYWGNSWVVTNDSITQIRQTSLFDKQTSQLSYGNLEDITAEQDGVLEQMLNYGTLSAETAGASDKFIFSFCPNPNYFAKQILAAREDFEQHRHRDTAGKTAPAPRPSARSAVDLGIAAVESLSEKDD